VKDKAERGMSLIELMIAMVVLTVGLGGIMVLLVGAIASNNRNSRDTTATLLAQMVVEQISAQHVYSDATINVTDCAGTNWTIATNPGAVGTGSGATLKSNGAIDFTQSYSSITSHYAMRYVDCSASGGIQTTYEVRWNVMSVSTNLTSRMITAAARPVASNVNQLGGLFFALPANLRGIGAPVAGQ
jgi:prepilin-type N-terminal cleavage/methylation domain-containing protein